MHFYVAQSVMLLIQSYQILRDCVIYTEFRRAKTVTINDVSDISCASGLRYANVEGQVIHSLKRIGRPIYGFDDTNGQSSRLQKAKPAPATYI